MEDWTREQLQEYIIENGLRGDIKGFNKLKKIDLLLIASKGKVSTRTPKKSPPKKSYLSELPPDMIRSIAHNLPISDVKSLSETNKNISNTLLRNPQFLKERLRRDFPYKDLSYIDAYNDDYITKVARHYIITNTNNTTTVKDMIKNVKQLYKFYISEGERFLGFLRRNLKFRITVYRKSIEFLAETRDDELIELIEKVLEMTSEIPL